MLKKEIRVIGIDDSPFNKFKKGKVLVVGTVFRGGLFLDGVLSTKVNIDGNDSTKKITEMINKCKFKPQLQCIFLDGIAVVIHLGLMATKQCDEVVGAGEKTVIFALTRHLQTQVFGVEIAGAVDIGD